MRDSYYRSFFRRTIIGKNPEPWNDPNLLKIYREAGEAMAKGIGVLIRKLKKHF